MKINEVIGNLLTEHWKKHGFTKEETEIFLIQLGKGLADQAIHLNIDVYIDDNDYEK